MSLTEGLLTPRSQKLLFDAGRGVKQEPYSIGIRQPQPRHDAMNMGMMSVECEVAARRDYVCSRG
jgi:hypothetical protein